MKRTLFRTVAALEGPVRCRCTCQDSETALYLSVYLCVGGRWLGGFAAVDGGLGGGLCAPVTASVSVPATG